MRPGHRRLIGGVAALLIPLVGSAQIVRSSGVDATAGRDNRWSVSTNSGESWFAAFLVGNRPGAWAQNVEGVYGWISATESGTGGGGNYRARTQFTLGAGDQLSVTLRCTADNTPLGIFINAVLVGTSSGCGPSNTYQLAPALTFTQWITGLNTLEIRWTGDNTTDGALVAIDRVAFTPGNGPPGVVPEPSTYLLMVTGLGVLSLLARRRTTQV